MLQHEKAEVIQECIDLVRNSIAKRSKNPQALLATHINIEALEQFKAEVDALAEQEWEKMCNDLWNDQETIKVGVPWACIDMTPAEMQKRDYIRP